MLRKVTLSLLAAVLVAGTVTTVPAQAATKVSNGVACSKSGAKTSSGGSTYICTKNQLVKNSKLTWLSSDCVNLIKSYLVSKANLPKVKAQSDATIAKIAADLLVQQEQAKKAQGFIDDYNAKILVIQKAIDVMHADTVNLVKNKPTITKYQSAILSYKAAIRAYEAVLRGLKSTQTAQDKALTTYEGAKEEVASGLETANLICRKGW